MGPVITSHVARYPNLEYIAQDRDSLRLLLWGDEPEGASPSSPMPIHRSHPLIRDDKTRFYVDPWPWLDDVRRMDFMFGTRIHGNIVALLAGTPTTSSPTTRARSSWRATSRSRTGRPPRSRPTRTRPTCMQRRTTRA